MSRCEPYETDIKPERALLVGVEFPSSKWSLDDTMAELKRLTATAGAECVYSTTQRLASPNPRSFVGTGKAKEIASLCLAHAVDVVIFDDDLSPSQQSNLEHIVPDNVKVIDRTALILDIFALHAHTKAGRLQVRLAQNEYLLPRLRGMWAHLASNRMGGGVGSRFGEGESQLEVDRRIVRKRITSIKRQLDDLSKNRSTQRSQRTSSGMLHVALAGYTNAGKSCLLNALTHADVLSHDKLFATLDSTTRKLTLPEGREVTLTDTVGFIQKLPTTLIDAFKSTLDEIVDADVIIHVIDASADNFVDQMQAVDKVLGQIHAGSINKIVVFNKIDLLDQEHLEALRKRYADALFISAKDHQGIDELISQIARIAAAQDRCVTLLVPYQRGDIVSFVHERCFIINETHTDHGTQLIIRVNRSLYSHIEPFIIEHKESDIHL
ncbi:MAG: GTPase HflX [Eggerthellaceae bacterium]|jgi:GTP-binding protein HflX|nr:GTPase HflX [Eggerthellaceae bacterium]